MEIATLEKRLEREKKARIEAERILEAKALELYEANQRHLLASKALKEQTTQLNAILENTRAGILLVNELGFVCRANRAAEILFSVDAKAFIGKAATDFIVQSNSDALRPTATRMNGADISRVREDIAGRRLDGFTFPMELAVASVEIDTLPYTVWICRDITARKEEEAERAALERELGQAQKLESLGTLASGIAHEINTPVQYVTDNVQFMKDATADLEVVFDAFATLTEKVGQDAALKPMLDQIEKAKQDVDFEFILDEMPQALDHALEGLTQIAKIVAAIKSFAHPGTEERTLADINAAIDTTITVSRNKWKYVAELETDFQADLPPAPCFPGEFNQVMLNLIVNAAQAIEEKGADSLGKIKVSTRERAGSIEVLVTDTGCGIKPEHMDKIFDPFFTTKPVGNGTGQGLSLCYGIITNKHGGTISFDSEHGRGTTFSVRLPLKPHVTTEEAA